MKNTGLEISTTLNPWNYGDPVEGEAEEPEKKEFDPDAMVVVFNAPENGLVTIYFFPDDEIEGSENFLFDCVIDWGDGSPTEHIVESQGCYHNYEKAGIYYATISGSADCVQLHGNSYLIAIEQWGDLGVKTWYKAIHNCVNLATIPTGIPPSDSFYHTFANCGLKTIPAGLFSKCVSAKSFEYTFSHCQKLETIGEGVFANCISAENFEQTFLECPNLESIPADLFKDCINATSFFFYISTV